MKRFYHCFLMLLVIYLLALTSSAHSIEYTFTTIDFPGASYTMPYGINNAGQIVGYYDAGHNGFLLSGGIYTTLNVPGASYTIPYGINNASQVVGQYYKTGEYSFLLSGGSYTTLNVPGSSGTTPWGINNAGQIAGRYSNETGDNGFLLSGGSYTTLNVAGASGTILYGINDTGKIVGQYYNDSGYHGFLLSNGNYTTLNVPGATETTPFGINNAGQIVGQYYNGSGYHGFLLNGGSYTTLNVPGASYTIPYGINNAGQIVGQYYNSNNSNPIGFLATPKIVDAPKTYGLFIGISDFSTFVPFRGDKSVEMAMNIFVNNNIINLNNVYLIENNANNSLDASVFEKAFMSIGQKMKSGDTFFLYVAGHGNLMTDKGAYVETGPNPWDILASSMVSDYINKYMGDANERKFIIMDSCHSGAFWDDIQGSQNVALLTSASKENVAYYAPTGIGFFEYAISAAFVKSPFGYMMADSNQDNFVDFDELGNFIKQFSYPNIFDVMFEEGFGDSVIFDPTKFDPIGVRSGDFVDGIQGNQVPIPSTFLLFGSGFLSLILLRNRKFILKD